MSTVLFILFGILDLFAFFSLSFKIYSFPFREYFKELFVICCVVSIVSYINRIHLDLELFDTLAQLILLVLFMRYLIKVKLFPAMLISITGLVAYIAIQQFVIIALTYTNIIDAATVQQTSTIGIYTIQIVSDLTSYLICFLIYKFQLGTSKFMRPPHDFLIREKFKRRNAIIALVTFMAAIFIFFSFYMLMHLRILLLMPLILISFGLVIYLAYRREVRTG